MAPADRDWLQGALKAWPGVQRRYLKADERPLPTLVVYDAACRYVVTFDAGLLGVSQAVAYTGAVALPGLRSVPPGPNAIFFQTSAADLTVLMALPSVWAAAPHPRTVPLGWILEGALFHELTHAYQAAAAPSGTFAALRRRGLRGSSLHDDSIQDLYAADPSYAGLVTLERMTLNAVAKAADQAEARRAACEATEAMRDRRSRFAAKRSSLPLAEIDEIANTSEGLGNWVAYRWLTEDRGIAPDAAIAVLGGRAWSQIIGLALFRALDRTTPGWERRLLAEPPATGLSLLDEACRASAQ